PFRVVAGAVEALDLGPRYGPEPWPRDDPVELPHADLERTIRTYLGPLLDAPPVALPIVVFLVVLAFAWLAARFGAWPFALLFAALFSLSGVELGRVLAELGTGYPGLEPARRRIDSFMAGNPAGPYVGLLVGLGLI